MKIQFFDIDFKISLEALINPIKEKFIIIQILDILEKSIRNYSNIRNDLLTILSIQLQAKINKSEKIFNENLNGTSNKFLDILNEYINKKTL